MSATVRWLYAARQCLQCLISSSVCDQFKSHSQHANKQNVGGRRTHVKAEHMLRGSCRVFLLQVEAERVGVALAAVLEVANRAAGDVGRPQHVAATLTLGLLHRQRTLGEV